MYGSRDMGSTVRNDNKVFAKLMQKAGRLMNIKGEQTLSLNYYRHHCFFLPLTSLRMIGHLAGKSGSAFLYAPTDIEGHLGRDKRFYLLGELLLLCHALHSVAHYSQLLAATDFARTFPPSTPNVKEHPRGFLYQLLRPEFVFKYKTPLSRCSLRIYVALVLISPSSDNFDSMP